MIKPKYLKFVKEEKKKRCERSKSWWDRIIIIRPLISNNYVPGTTLSVL